MTRVDFYVLNSSEADGRLELVCRLTEKAVNQGQPVFIHSRDKSLLARLDILLWTFRPGSFVPHGIREPLEPASRIDADPVTLSAGEPAAEARVLINLDVAVPSFFSRFDRTLEVVDQQPLTRDAGRERYRFYKHRGYPLHHHAIA